MAIATKVAAVVRLEPVTTMKEVEVKPERVELALTMREAQFLREMLGRCCGAGANHMLSIYDALNSVTGRLSDTECLKEFGFKHTRLYTGRPAF